MAEFLKAMNLAELPDEGGLCVLLAGRKIALFQVGGEVNAIDDTCSHEEASLSAGMLYLDEDEPQIECPKHGSMFSIVTGQVFYSLPFGLCTAMRRTFGMASSMSQRTPGPSSAPGTKAFGPYSASKELAQFAGGWHSTRTSEVRRCSLRWFRDGAAAE
jgi:nitrite reductase/ring-hydroxylating ferredoxin subunit